MRPRWASAVLLAVSLHVGALFFGIDFTEVPPQAQKAVAMRFAPRAAPLPARAEPAVETPPEPPPPPKPRPKRKARPPKRREAKPTPPPANAPPPAPMRPTPAPVDSTPKPAPAPPVVRLGAYWKGFRQSVEAHKRYPRIARRLRLEGVVRVRVTVTKQGRLVGDPVVVRSSGHDVLDSEALRMVKAADASGFTVPLPSGWSQPTASFVLPFEFRLKG